MTRLIRIFGALAVFGAIVAVITMTAGGSIGLIRSATAATDTCGYPTGRVVRPNTVFNELETLRFSDYTADLKGVYLLYNDEHTLTLGAGTVETWDPTFTSGTLKADNATNPNVGTTTGAGSVDASNRPIFPAAFVTDLGVTVSPKVGASNTNRDGDWQSSTGTAGNGNGGANPPSFVAGTWKPYAGPSVNTNDTVKNNYFFGPDADTVPAGLTNQGFGADIRWKFKDLKDKDGNALNPGHTYRVQFMVHDGDQNKGGGDVGEGCKNFDIPPTKLKTNPPGGTPDSLGGFHDTVVLNVPADSYSDTATVAQDPPIATPATGSVHFVLFPPGHEDCLSGGIDAGTDSSAPFQSDPKPFNLLGSATQLYTWQATYTPDPAATAAGYFAATEACGLETVRTIEGRIKLAPLTRTNTVGTNHTVTATVETSINGTDWSAVPGVGVNFTITSSAGATCLPATAGPTTTNASGQAAVTFSSATAGDCTVHATSGFTLAGPPPVKGTFNLATNDGGGLSSSDAVKHYLDARIRLTPLNATNLVGADHTVTATVSYALSPTGPWLALNGVPVTFSITNNGTATCAIVATSAATSNTSGSGQTTVVINSPTVGNCDIHATTTFNGSDVTGNVLDGGSITRATGSTGAHSPSCSATNPDACNSADANKVYIKPLTDLTVSVVDTLTGLPTTTDGTTTTTGTVVYESFNNADCAVAHRISVNAVALVAGVVQPSPAMTAASGTTTYFTASYSGNLGNFTSPCTAESVAVVDQVP